VLLYATEAGRPVYQRLGFDADGEARAWRDVAPPAGGAPPDGVRALRPADDAAVRALDTAATGEDRGPVFDALGALDGNAGRAAGVGAATDPPGDGDAPRPAAGLRARPCVRHVQPVRGLR